MLPRNHLHRIRVDFYDPRLAANAGLLLPATLARHLVLGELVDHRLIRGNAPERGSTGDKMMTMVASALAGGDCTDDADALRARGRPVFSTAWSRRPRHWGRSCAAYD